MRTCFTNGQWRFRSLYPVPMSISEKAQIRKDMLARRKAVPQPARQACAQAIIDPLLAFIPLPAMVAGYAAAHAELELWPLIAALSARGQALCLPVVGQKGQMRFARFQPGARLTKDRYGIEIPEEIEEVLPDVLLVPLLAFDAAGHRLGYGGGYYDRAIAALRKRHQNVTCIGVGYSLQCHPRLPVEPTDMALDAIITENGFYALNE